MNDVPTRQEYMHISVPEKVLFYVLIFGSIAYMSLQIWKRSQSWQKGKPIDWKPNPIANITKFIVGQKKVRSSRQKSGAPMHLLLFYGFLTLFIGTTLLAINQYSPIKFHYGTYYLTYELVLDVMGGAFLVGVVWAFVRRALMRPKPLSHKTSDYWVLGLLFVLGLTGYILEAARMSNNPHPWDWSGPLGHALSSVLPTITNDGYRFIWWFHMVWVAVFIALLPRLRIKHIAMAILTAGGKPEQAMGTLMPISMEEVEKTGQIGVTEAKDYSRWHLMSLDACMECGRCTEVCPANGVGKTLNPKDIVQGILKASNEGIAVAEAVSEEALWACTTCNACVEACPVLIRHVDLIVDARRNLVAEGKLSGSSATMLRQSGSTSNAWGAPAGSREDWMKDLEIPLARDGDKFDVLLWVGCAGATDPGAVKTTKALAGLLKRAGVSFACLGKEEKCTGDAARRVGDEFLYQELANQNVETFSRYGVKKIVTPCPHCMNTLKNEYGQFGGEYEVSHHSQFLMDLVEKGKLKAANPEKGSVTYHDPCYLARVNNISDEPRGLLGEKSHLDSGAIPSIQAMESASDGPGNLAEPQRKGRKTLCCGAGGGRMWMEEAADQRPGNRRAEELLATGAKTVAVGCPFCRIMLDASVKQVTDDEIRLVDLAEMLQEANA